MAHLPSEILSIIFNHLDRKDTLECCLVCQAWYATALYWLNSRLYLRQPEDVLVLFEKLYQPGGIQGDNIRYLSFLCVAGNNPTLRRVIFTNILKYCKKIKVLDFSNMSRGDYIDYMIRERSNFQLNSLQCIKRPYNLTGDYIRVNWLFSRSITCLDLHITTNSFRQLPEANDLYTYLKQFPVLKTLLVSPLCTVFLHSLLSACPRLESLKLSGSLRQNHLEIYSNDLMEQHDSIRSQIKYLRLDVRQVSQQLLEYLNEKVNQLFRLEIVGSTFVDYVDADAFNALLDSELPIRHLELGDEFALHHNMFIGLNRNFRALSNVKLKNCNYKRLMDENSNVTLDFNAMDLEYLALDFSNVLSDSKRISSVSLVIDQNEADTTYYHRTSKWASRHLFNRKESSIYIATQERRLSSKRCSVITIKAKTLTYLQMHLYGFNQLIQL